MVAAIRGDFCSLFGLEMTRFAHFSCFGHQSILKLNEYFTRAETYYLYAASLSIERHLSSRSLGRSRGPFGGDRFEPYPFRRD